MSTDESNFDSQVYHVWHFCAKFDEDLDYSSEKEDGQHPHFIGLFSSLERAEAAVARCRHLPGFNDWPDSFRIYRGRIESDGWETGFFTTWWSDET